MKPRFRRSQLCTALHLVTLSLTVLVAGLSCESEMQERKVVISPSETPVSVRAAIEGAFPKGQIVAIEKEVEGEDPGQYDVNVRSEGKEYEVEVSPEGKVIEIEEQSPAKKTQAPDKGKRWTDSFHIEDCTFASVGGNRFFSLQPGHQLVLQSKREKVTITVLDETVTVAGVETRVVEEREEEDGELKEVSRNFFALCKEHGDVFYFGEEVDDYENGKVVRHSGEWRADEPNSKAGIIMPGTILLGARYYQEFAPKARDRAEIDDDDVTLKTPAGTFTHCLRVEETSGLDPDERCYKTYAPGVGLIQDENLLLTEHRMGK